MASDGRNLKNIADNCLVLLQWGRTCTAFPSMDHYWCGLRHGVRKEENVGAPSFEGPVGTFTSKRSSAINQLINQLINQSTNQSNHQSISGPSCRFACKASQEHKRVKGNLISGFLFKKNTNSQNSLRRMVIPTILVGKHNAFVELIVSNLEAVLCANTIKALCITSNKTEFP